ncbi:Fc.00g110190.m01.CDS01 [Cosmosporella sp. VM-42]
MESVIKTLQGFSPAQWCQTFFLVSANLVFAVQALPNDVSKTLMNYGARRPTENSDKAEKEKSKGLKRFAELVTSYGQVPHQWFLHFYILSTSLSAFWAWQYFQKGYLMRELAVRQAASDQPTMQLGQVFAAWLMMTLQGSRRLYESLYVSKPGSSPMWFVHWALGLVYYTSMSIAVWIEGSSAILASWESPQETRFFTRRVVLALALYCFACFKQNQCHRYLATLKKYTLPSQGWFEFLVCPHYTSECLIYVAIASAAAPPGRLFNNSVLCGLIFVGVNLGATAEGTKKWYAEKFGADKVAQRSKMIPGVF